MLKPALQLRLGQQLTMTPQLQQAIKLLQLPVLELQAQVQQALETNVMLEVDEEESQELTPAESEQTVDQQPDADEGAREEEVSVEMVDPWEDASTPAGREANARRRRPAARVRRRERA